MLLALGLALLPLGGVAIFASIDTARGAYETRMSDSRFTAEVAARRLSNTISRTAISLRAASTAVSSLHGNARECRNALDALARIQQIRIDFAMYREGEPVCTTSGFPAPASAPAAASSEPRPALDVRTGAVRFTMVSAGLTGVAEIPARSLDEAAQLLRPIDNYRLELRQGNREFVVRNWSSGEPRSIETIETPLADGDISLIFAFETMPIRPIELLSIMLPLVMWLVAVFLGWFLVRQILLRPLATLERAVSGYSAGDRQVTLGRTRHPTAELRSLGDAFENFVVTVRRHEQDLEAGIAEQVRLTREVHHRVKNNLQVVASLLSLHARGAKTPEIAAAYASIQRRVDALAIVQRNLFAEADPREGISLRPVLAELASGLQQTAPQTVRLVISLNVADFSVSQDTAVPVAFLVTELVELAMLADGSANIAINLEEVPEEPIRARLEVRSLALSEQRGKPDSERYHRVLAGLSRQLRSQLDHDSDRGAYSIAIPVISADSRTREMPAE